MLLLLINKKKTEDIFESFLKIIDFLNTLTFLCGKCSDIIKNNGNLQRLDK